MQNSRNILIIFLVIAVVLLGGVFVWYLGSPAASVKPSYSGNSPFGESPLPSGPSGSSTGTATSTGAAPAPTLSLPTRDGGTISATDFTASPDVTTLQTRAETGGEETYYSFASTTKDGYQIFYFPSEGSFYVAITKEPLAQYRHAAEADLGTRLGLTDAELCSIVTRVSVTNQSLAFYLGKDLGFAGCKGATALPGD